MPCYLFTYHAFGSWMPDREEGFVRRGEGVLPSDEPLGRQYRERAGQSEVTFDAAVQALLIAECRTAFEKQRCRGHYVATETTHLHVLVSWPDERDWSKLRAGLRASLSRRLNKEYGKRAWFVDGSSRRRVKDQDHFDHLVTEYLPNHGGWKWREGAEPFQ